MRSPLVVVYVNESTSWLRCIGCGMKYPSERKVYRCGKCGDLLEVVHDFQGKEWKTDKMSGVWRYRPMIYPEIEEKHIITMGEGNTYHHRSGKASEWTGISSLYLKQEGENPTGSFKDRGMTVAVSEAVRLGAKATICASTGNTSASSAAYSALGELESYVLVPEGNVSRSKIAQAIAYGSKIIRVKGDFDSAMDLLREAIEANPDYYLLNSINPWRIEGQKSISYEIMEKIPEADFIALPAGNLGNTTAVGKGLNDLREIGIIDQLPRIISVQAEGASPFYRLWSGQTDALEPMKAETVASAIKIGNPVNWKKAMKVIQSTNGLVCAVSDSEIIEAKRIIDASGIGCEPASAASVAGVRKLVEEGTLDRSDTVVSVLTGNILKDIDSITVEEMEYRFEDLLGHKKEIISH